MAARSLEAAEEEEEEVEGVLEEEGLTLAPRLAGAFVVAPVVLVAAAVVAMSVLALATRFSMRAFMSSI